TIPRTNQRHDCRAALRGMGTALGQATDTWTHHSRLTWELRPARRRSGAAAARAWLDRWAYHRNRISVGSHTTFRRHRCRVCALEGRCHLHVGNPANRCRKEGNIGNPDRIWRSIDWRSLPVFLIGGVLGVPAGVYLLLQLPTGTYRHVIGG